MALVTPVIGSKQMKLGTSPFGRIGTHTMATSYFGPKTTSTFLPSASIENVARPLASRTRPVNRSSRIEPASEREDGRSIELQSAVGMNRGAVTTRSRAGIVAVH